MSHRARGVCIDATYKVNDYSINLITLMVLDDFQEGIPVAWALSTREDKCTLVHILIVIKEICGPLEVSWFMSDMAPQYFTDGRKFLDKTKLSIYGVPGILIGSGRKD